MEEPTRFASSDLPQKDQITDAALFMIQNGVPNKMEAEPKFATRISLALEVTQAQEIENRLTFVSAECRHISLSNGETHTVLDIVIEKGGREATDKIEGTMGETKRAIYDVYTGELVPLEMLPEVSDLLPRDEHIKVNAISRSDFEESLAILTNQKGQAQEATMQTIHNEKGNDVDTVTKLARIYFLKVQAALAKCTKNEDLAIKAPEYLAHQLFPELDQSNLVPTLKNAGVIV